MSAAIPKNLDLPLDRRDRSKDRPTAAYVRRLERELMVERQNHEATRESLRHSYETIDRLRRELGAARERAEKLEARGERLAKKGAAP